MLIPLDRGHPLFRLRGASFCLKCAPRCGETLARNPRPFVVVRVRIRKCVFKVFETMHISHKLHSRGCAVPFSGLLGDAMSHKLRVCFKRLRKRSHSQMTCGVQVFACALCVLCAPPQAHAFANAVWCASSCVCAVVLWCVR